MSITAQLKAEAQRLGVEVIDHGGGHFHLKKDRLINYWPHSERMTAVDGSGKTHYEVDPEQAVRMAIVEKPTPQRIVKGDKQWLDKFSRELIVSAVQGAAIDCKPFDDAPVIADAAIAIRNAVFERLGLTTSD